MKTTTSAIRPLLAVASVACFLASGGVNADALHITVASASNNNAYDLSFAPPGATSLGVTPLPKASSVQSLAYVANEATAKNDLIAADYNGSRIVLYANATGTASTVWAAPSAGPLHPNGLAVDGSTGNLFVNRGDVGHPQVWVLPRAGAGFAPPVLMDGSSFGTSRTTLLLDALVVNTATPGGLGAGDLLILVSDGRVLRYSAQSIKSFLAHTGLVPGPQTLIPTSRYPNGYLPTGMALWPAVGTADANLLVATVGGAVLRFSLTPPSSAPMTAFTTGLGLSLGKIKTFLRWDDQNKINVPYAVFAQPLRNKVFELGAPPAGGCPNLRAVCNGPQPSMTVTTVSTPAGLATTDASVPSTACVVSDSNPNGCTLLGGAVTVGVTSGTPPPPGATVVAVTCTVDDPRVDLGPGSNNTGQCIEGRAGTPSPLKASDLCPGYPNTVIPSWTCGASGATGRSMSFIKFEEHNGFTQAPSDLLVNVELSAQANLGTSTATCPQLADDWAPLVPAETPAFTPVVGDQLQELDSHCGSGVGLKPGHSLMLVGVQMVGSNFPGGLVGIANQKFDVLSAAVTAANMPATPKAALASCVTKAKDYLNSGVLQPQDQYACSAHQAWTCDQTVVANQFGTNPDTLSALSAIKGRLENLVMHINNRIAHPNGPAPTTWPQPDPGLPDGTNCDPDTTPPTTPLHLQAAYAPSLDGKSMTLSWDASTDPDPNATGVAGYQVYLNDVPYPAPNTLTTNNVNFPITLSVTGERDVVTVTVRAFDYATPTPNKSSAASTPVTCYDSDPDPDEDNDCEQYPAPTQ